MTDEDWQFLLDINVYGPSIPIPNNYPGGIEQGTRFTYIRNRRMDGDVYYDEDGTMFEEARQRGMYAVLWRFDRGYWVDIERTH
jgi:hypothetical protein